MMNKNKTTTNIEIKCYQCGRQINPFEQTYNRNDEIYCMTCVGKGFADNIKDE